MEKFVEFIALSFAFTVAVLSFAYAFADVINKCKSKKTSVTNICRIPKYVKYVYVDDQLHEVNKNKWRVLLFIKNKFQLVELDEDDYLCDNKDGTVDIKYKKIKLL